MNDPSLDSAMRLVDDYVGGALDADTFDTKLGQLSASDPEVVTRITTILEQRHRDGALTAADLVVLRARLESGGNTRYTSHDRGGTGIRVRHPHGPGACTRTEMGAPRGPRVSIEATLKPGVIVKERFLLEQKIGEGGMGLVFKARDIRNERYQEFVAIKGLSDLLQDNRRYALCRPSR